MGISTGVDDTAFVNGKPITYGELPPQWPQFGRTPDNQAYNPNTTISDSPTEKWSISTPGTVFSDPVLGDDAVYVGSNDMYVYAFEKSDGSLRWSYNTGGNCYYGGAYNDGVLFYPGGDQVFIAFNTSDGSIKWSVDTGGLIKGAPVFKDGVVYLTTNNSPEVRALNANDGSEIWTQTINEDPECDLALSNGVLYVGSWGDFYAINASDGSVKWTRAISNFGGPTVFDGTVYFGEVYTKSLYALNASDGTTQWTFESESTDQYADKDFIASPAVVDGTVFAPNRDNFIYAVNAADGSKQWKTDLISSLYGAPSIADGKVILGGYQEVVALNVVDGAEIWSKTVDGYDVESNPAVAEGTVYVGCSNSGASMYAFE